MPTWIGLVIYLLGVVFSVLINAAVLSYLAGRHTKAVDELVEWRKDNSRIVNKISSEVAYLSGRMNGGTYKHERLRGDS